jgi:acetolactate synthase I/II/III large subunit
MTCAIRFDKSIFLFGMFAQSGIRTLQVRNEVVKLEAGSLPRTGAESVLTGLKRHGVDYLFANAGTDFPPIIEAFCALPEESVPIPVTIPHETASVAMAHGYYLVTGRAQAVMVHVNVGLANAAMGVINAASDDVPVLVMSGRTPVTETGRAGGRTSPIHYGQEMYHQSAIVSDVVKYHYEMRYPEQGEPLVSRALAVAMSAPRGPVYLSLPREPLSERVEPQRVAPVHERPPARPSAPDLDAIATLAKWLEGAEMPVVLVQRGDWEGRLSQLLCRFAERHAVAVVEPFMVRNVMPSLHPMLAGYDPKTVLGEADLVIILDCDVPWIESISPPRRDCRFVHIAPDPHFSRMPVRGHKTDLAITADPVSAVAALETVSKPEKDRIAKRHTLLSDRSRNRRLTAMEAARKGCTAPMSAAWLSHCVSEAMDENAQVFTELGVLPGMMTLAGPNRVFANTHAGGLGWAMPAALGAQLADRERLVIACMGDGSYIFANPTACHQIAEAHNLPILTIVKNNGLWNAVRRSVISEYPGGAAARSNRMPFTSLEPSPDYLKIAEASRAHAERVEHGNELPEAIERAINVIHTEKRQAMLEVMVEVSDNF